MESLDNKPNPTRTSSACADAAAMPEGSPLPREAWDALAAERAALADDQLVPVNLDVQAAATLALGAYPEIRALRARALAELVGFDPQCIDKLPLYASAAYHGQTLYQTSVADLAELPAMYDEALKLRDLLSTDLAPLVKRGLVDGSRLKQYDGGIGYRIVAADLAMLVATFRAHLPKLAGRTTIAEMELDHTERLAQRIVLAVGQRDQGPAIAAASAIERQRALTLFMRSYDEVRRVVSYLRWREGDADRIAPSAYGPRVRGSKRKGDETGSDAAAPSSSGSTSNAASVSPSGTPDGHDEAVALPAGMNPFIA